jgi:hypothetical protein
MTHLVNRLNITIKYKNKIYILSSSVFPYDEAERKYGDVSDADIDSDLGAAFGDVYLDISLVGFCFGVGCAYDTYLMSDY